MQFVNNNFGTSLFKSYGFNFDYPYTQPIYPIISVLFYIFTVIYFSPSDNNKSSSSKSSDNIKKSSSKPFKVFVFIHNFVLCLFSFIVFLNVFPKIILFIYNNSWETFSCQGMTESELYWSYLFYLSKIWEFIDTWIILYKGRKPSSLQTYHHIGAVFACWLQVIVKGTTFWIFVSWNSFIHTIMYFYYCYTTFGYKFKFKFIITILQLTQFITGQGFGFYQVFIKQKTCIRTNDFWVWVFNSIYVWPLVALFANFYIQTYLKKKQKKM